MDYCQMTIWSSLQISKFWDDAPKQNNSEAGCKTLPLCSTRDKFTCYIDVHIALQAYIFIYIYKSLYCTLVNYYNRI